MFSFLHWHESLTRNVDEMMLMFCKSLLTCHYYGCCSYCSCHDGVGDDSDGYGCRMPVYWALIIAFLHFQHCKHISSLLWYMHRNGTPNFQALFHITLKWCVSLRVCVCWWLFTTTKYTHCTKTHINVEMKRQYQEQQQKPQIVAIIACNNHSNIATFTAFTHAFLLCCSNNCNIFCGCAMCNVHSINKCVWHSNSSSSKKYNGKYLKWDR